MSRLPRRYKCEGETDNSGKQDRIELSSQIVGALCSSLHRRPLVETFCLSRQGLPVLMILDLGVRDWRAAQQGDPVIGKFVRCVINYATMSNLL